MLTESSLATIQQFTGRLTKPVRLIVFTTDTGCPSCPEMLELSRAIKAKLGKIALEAYDAVMDRDKAQQYGVTVTPCIVVQGAEGPAVLYSGRIHGIILDALLHSIQNLSNGKSWFPQTVLNTLKRLSHDVRIRVFVKGDCADCRLAVDTAAGMGLSSTLISSEIIAANDFPDLVRKYGVTGVPKAVFGENLFLDGPATQSEFLEMVFQAEGVKPGPERRCIMCGNPSSDAICQQCKTRVEAEAKDHKLKVERK